MRCAVVGAGAWGTALADLLARSGHAVCLWALEDDVVRSVNGDHQNPVFLPGFTLAATLTATHDLREALEGAEFIVYAAPSQHLRKVTHDGSRFVSADAVLAVASKGIEVGSLSLMSDVIAEEVPGRAVVAISGPSFAAEVAARQPTAIVAASNYPDAARLAQDAMSNATFRVYTHDDLIGVELGGALKNVMAVATGIVEGLGLGNNSRAALITRGLAEMTRLGVAIGARASTFAGLAGIGDLVLTCTGALSRNRAVGVEIGQGRTLEQALAGKPTVAEGVVTTRSALALAQREDVEMPIAGTVYRILFEGHPAHRAIPELMERGLRSEQDA
ncbi:MAG TPA: NAD(P)H-dependent glycerol-3-phosphate dehydrogenase [Gemmatimonadaceae bacterium]|nr:NAD(P)H-dependent glycerol-3-phosphate dehydrogenase [Gemmatimonadaceae bacterium]